MKKELNVALIGYQFMGRAHSNAWRQVNRFFDSPLEPVMKVVVGRNEAGVKKAAETLGWQEHATSWEQVVARKDIDIVDVCTPGDSHMAISIAAGLANILETSIELAYSPWTYVDDLVFTHDLSVTLQRDPNDVLALDLLGIVLAAQGHRQEAAARFEQALKLDPGNAQVLSDYQAALGNR